MWVEAQDKRSKSVAHASFMVDGMELILLGVAGVIAWVTLGLALPPKPLSCECGSGGEPYVPAPPPTCGEMKAAYDAFRAQGDSGSASRVLRDAEAEGCPWATFTPTPTPTPRISGGFGGKSGGGPLIQAALGGTTATAPPVAPTTAATRPGGSSALIV